MSRWPVRAVSFALDFGIALVIVIVIAVAVNADFPVLCRISGLPKSRGFSGFVDPSVLKQRRGARIDRGTQTIRGKKDRSPRQKTQVQAFIGCIHVCAGREEERTTKKSVVTVCAVTHCKQMAAYVRSRIAIFSSCSGSLHMLAFRVAQGRSRPAHRSGCAGDGAR